MNILIVNQHTNNFGDDLAGCTLINNILNINPDCKINLIYNTKGLLPINDNRVLHNRDITFKNIGLFSLIKYFILGKNSVKNNKIFTRFLTIISLSDYIFVSPCGANIGIYKDWQFLLRLLIIVKENKTPIFHLNTIGKSNSLIFNILSKKILKKSVIYVREKKSKEFLDSLNIKSTFGPDTAFSYQTFNNKKENKISFIPTQLSFKHPSFKKYDFDKIVKFQIVKNLSTFSQKNGIPIHLVPHLNSEEEKKFYLEIKKEFENNNVKIYIDEINNVNDYVKCISSSRFVIGMRYHAIVTAIKECVPFISLSYENKMIEVCSYSRMKKYCINLFKHCYSNDNFNKLLYEMLKNENDIQVHLSKIIVNLEKQSKLPLEQIEVKK